MYYIQTLALLLGFTLRVTSALYVDPGCVVKSEWKSDWLWSDAHLTAWVPPGHNSAVFTLLISLGEDGFPVTYDNITLTVSGVEFWPVRYGEGTKVKQGFADPLGSGWQEFGFTATSRYELQFFNLNKNIPLNTTVNLPVKSIELTGSNITLNCPKKMLVWAVKNKPAVVPLDCKEDHWLSIFSSSRVSPSLTLGERKVKLGWINNGLTTVGGSNIPLPAFTQHYITLTCGNTSGIMCDIKFGETRTYSESLKQSEWPGSVMVEGRSGDDFFLLLHLQDPYPPSPQPATMNNTDAPCAVAAGPNTVAIALGVLLLLVVGAGLALGYFCYYRYLPRRLKDKTSAGDLEMPEKESLLKSGNKYPATTEPSQKSLLWNAVMSSCPEKISHLVEQCVPVNRNTYIEANILGSQQVVDGLASVSPPIPRDELINEVMKEYECRVDKIFVAAILGQYKCYGGVDVLLRSYQLSTLVRDKYGRNIIHYAASAKGKDGEPLWQAVDVRTLVKDQNCLLNARDYEGCTCLHLLAEAANIMDLMIIWDGKKVTVSAAWIKMANILISAGADPRLNNNEGQLPQKIAKRKGKIELSELLIKECKKLGDITHKDVDEKFQKLVEAVHANDLETLKKSLQSNTPLLPLGAHVDPLTEAVKYGHLEVVLLLLSAGSPLCGRSLVSITALEGSHGRPRLPAIFPAIMRKEYANKLDHEASKGSPLHENVQNLAAEVREKGHKFSWKFIQGLDGGSASKKARKLLCSAAGLGMSLTCQMLGLEGVYLHPLPGDEQPVELSLEKHQYETLYTLRRDLNMSLLSIMKVEELPSELSQEAETFELKQLKQFIRRRVPSSVSCQNLIKQVDDAYHNKLPESLDKIILLGICRHGLVSLFHKFRNNVHEVDVNTIVEELTGYTMLHMAALYGCIGLVDYLLYNKANVLAKTKGELTAPHLAAIKGNKECMEYLIGFKSSKGININHPTGEILVPTPEQLAEGYQSQVKAFDPVLLPEEYGLEVLSELCDVDKARLVLEKKGLQFNITNSDTLLMCAMDWSSREVGKEKVQLQGEMERFLGEVSKTDQRFKGTIVSRSRKVEPLNKLPVDSLQIYWEVDGLEPGKCEHECADTCTVTLKLIPKQEKLGTSQFKADFERAVKQTLKTYKCELPTLWLIYPFVTMIETGVSVYFAWYQEKITTLLRIEFIPMIKVKYPDDNLEKCPSFAKDCVDQNVPVHLANIRDDIWTYVLVQMEDSIFSRLTHEQLLVFKACKMLRKMLWSCWWFPNHQSRRHGRTWHAYTHRLHTLSNNLLMSLFLEEIRDSKEDDWEPSRFLEHVISTFKRATEINVRGERVPRQNIRLVLDPQHTSESANYVTLAIINYLEQLREKCD
ncbi:uncharacterized protein LOC121871447 [Homarus americanus]|uniref:uncharacterized protein LOC121871447 n=1 Tax=Homarus americanus TaxID=6706 RepID=UPI001C4527E9|nr:uncharacterized protein LOC121871447 [Homarus americanus]